MDRLKKFLAEKKVNKNFKKAGTGYRLTNDSSSAVSSQQVPVQQQIVTHFHSTLRLFKLCFSYCLFLIVVVYFQFSL